MDIVYKLRSSFCNHEKLNSANSDAGGDTCLSGEIGAMANP